MCVNITRNTRIGGQRIQESTELGQTQLWEQDGVGTGISMDIPTHPVSFVNRNGA